MGRYVKNKQLTAGSHAIVLPLSSTFDGPQTPVNGQIKYDQDTDQFTVFGSSGWRKLALVGDVNITRDMFVGDGVMSTFTMTKSYLPDQAANMLVFVANVFQNPFATYTVNGYDITFVGVPADTVPIVILHNFNSTSVV